MRLSKYVTRGCALFALRAFIDVELKHMDNVIKLRSDQHAPMSRIRVNSNLKLKLVSLMELVWHACVHSVVIFGIAFL